MKFLLLLVVLAVVVMWVVARQGRRKATPPLRKATADKTSTNAAPAKMLACARCGVHLPSTDAVFDDTGRAFCGAEHRLAGPG